MRKYEKWMIAMDLSRNDMTFLQNVATLANQFLPSEIHLVYVQQDLNIPKSVLKDIPDLHMPDVKLSENKMKAMMKACFHADHRVKVHVKTGNTLSELLKFSQKNDIDLIALSRPKMTEVSIRTVKLVRKATCSVLLVPEELTNPEVNKVLIPIDFSKYSDMALQVVNEFEQGPIVPKVHALHVYKDGTRYLDQVFETKDEIDAVLNNQTAINAQLEKYAQHELEEYLSKRNQPSIEKHIAPVSRTQPINEPIDVMINEIQPELVIIGSKGKDTSAAALLGEVSESMVPKKGNHMTLILKQKGENLGIIKSLLGLNSFF